MALATHRRPRKPDFTRAEVDRRLEEADRFGPGAWEAELEHMKRLVSGVNSIEEALREHRARKATVL